MKKPVIIFLHLGYWLLYAFLHLFLYAMMREGDFRGPGPASWSFLMLEFALFPALLAFYTFYTVLFTRLLAKRKIFFLVVAALLVSVFTAVPAELLMYTTFHRFSINWTFETSWGMGVIISFNALLNGILGLVMRGFISWYGDIKIKEELNKKNYEVELELVKSQINPHFLFNTINNIDILILKDPEKASNYLNKLSDMMRFMLYETKTSKVPLSKELDYINKYIDLQKIRTSNERYVNYNVQGSPDKLMLEPMLFIPFIENAFKHAENKRIENAVKIDFVITNDRITFNCSNHYSSQQEKPDHSGIGNDLIRKRITLLYPKDHNLEITDKDNTYTVKIELTNL